MGYGPTQGIGLGTALAPHTAELQARRVVIAGGAIGSAGLLLRSRAYLPGSRASSGATSRATVTWR